MPNYIKFYKNKGEEEKGRIIRNKERKKYYNKYNFSKERILKKYTVEEAQMILKNPFQSDIELAKFLTCSVQAVQTKRCRLKKLVIK